MWAIVVPQLPAPADGDGGLFLPHGCTLGDHALDLAAWRSPGPTLRPVSEPTGKVAVLVPVKAFRDAKARLGPVLSSPERIALAHSMADVVVRAAAPLPVWVVCDDEDVAAWALECGLPGAVEAGPRPERCGQRRRRRPGDRGFARVIVAHADLPHATDLTWVGDTEGVTLIPDRHDDGTNVAAVPARCGFVFSYGPGSFVRHCAEARRLGLELRVVREPRLAWDVDRPDDLQAPDWSACP